MTITFDYDQVTTSRIDAWSDFRKYLDGTIATLAFQYDDRGDFYTVVTEPYAGVTQQISLPKGTSSPDTQDFENNFKDTPPRRTGTFDGNSNNTLVERNNQQVALSESLQTQALLQQILLELKKMNAHLQLITDAENIELDLQ
jgi:hypothetical protein